MPKVFLKSKYFKTTQANKIHLMNYLAYLHRQSPLFSGTEDVTLADALETMQQYSNTICWSQIYSLNEEDVRRLEIDREYMKALMESQKNEISKALHISPENLVLYASYHNTAHHPHLHFIVRSKKRSEGYVVPKEGESKGEVFRNARETIKSSLTNEIFREYLHQLKVGKSDIRNELNEQFENVLSIGMNTHCVSSEIQDKMYLLQKELKMVSGKKFYGYLPPHLKEQVDDILKTIVETDPQINQLYHQYYNCQKNLIDGMYVQKPEKLAKKMEKWQNEFFHPPKECDTKRHNLIIQTACRQISSQRYKEKLDYQHKSQSAALRSMLYHIGQSLHEDNRRLSNVPYYSAPKPKKIMTKKIQKEIQVDQTNHIEVGGM